MAGLINPGVEILISGVWTDISSDVYYRDSINISRGRANEGAQSDTATMTLTLDNRTGNYSPRNPRGNFFNEIGRNTKIRAFVQGGQTRARHDGNDYFAAPDSAGLSITGDIDIRADVWFSTWRPLTSSYIGVLKDNAYLMYVNSDGTLSLSWYRFGVYTSRKSLLPIPGGTVGRKSVRATLDVANGANHVVTYYYSSDQTMSGTWIQFDQLITAGNVSIDDSVDEIKTLVYGHTSPSEVNQIQIYQGIGGTLRANPTFTAQPSGTTSFTDSTGNVWSNSVGLAVIDNRHYRFWGSISEWPIKRDTSGVDRYVTLTANGLTRRLGQGNAPVQSPLRRAIPTIGTPLVGYWPLEDVKGTVNPEAVIGSTARPKYVGSVEPGAYTGFVASAQAPTMNSGRIKVTVQPYVNTNYFQVRFLLRLSSTTIPNNTVLARINTNSSLGWIDWLYSTGDFTLFKTYSNIGTLSMISAAIDITPQIAGQDCIVSLEFKKNGSGVDIKQVLLPVGEIIGVTNFDTNAGVSLGSCTSVYLNPDGAAIGDVSFGHLRVEKIETSVFNLWLQTAGFRSETAVARISRLCLENGITPSMAGISEPSEAMGVQTRATILSLLQEAANLDGGILAEAKSSDGLRYRSRESLCTQDPALKLSYTASALTSFDPIDDDQRARNKVTVTRTNGTISTVEDTTSTMSTKAPPLGIGEYAESISLPLYTDDQTQHQAGWRVNLGTIDESRYPTIGLNLAHPDYTSDPVLTRSVLLTDFGDRIVITNPPAGQPLEQVDQIVQGTREMINQYEHSITFNCAPARPYRVAQQNASAGWTARYTNESSTLSTNLLLATTAVPVIHTSGPDWTIADGSFDIMVGGERMTVTNITGTGTQTFTVVRSVNGLTKAHNAGEAVRLFDPVVYGITGKAGAASRYLRAMDVNLPDPVSEYGNGTNIIVATTFAPLPTTPVGLTIYNPHPDRKMIVLVGYGGWGSIITTAPGFRVSTLCTRANYSYVTTGPSANGPIGWGEILYVGCDLVASFFAMYTTTLDPSIFPYYFTTQAYRDAAVGVNAQTWMHPTLRVTPIGYV